MGDEEGIQMEDEPGLLDDAADDVMTHTEEEEIKTEGEEPAAEEEREENRARHLEEHQEEQVRLTQTKSKSAY